MFTQGQKGLQNFCGIIGINMREFLYPRLFQERNPHVNNEGAELFFQTNLTLSFTRYSSDRTCIAKNFLRLNVNPGAVIFIVFF
jgi:hypothetical protein